MTIEEWLAKFNEAWLSKNIDNVLALFSEDVIYFETPFVKINSYDELRKEWLSIKDQDDLYLDLKLFSSQENRHTVLWSLGYATSPNSSRELSGTYLICLNDEGLCTYFHQTGELKLDYSNG